MRTELKHKKSSHAQVLIITLGCQLFIVILGIYILTGLLTGDWWPLD